MPLDFAGQPGGPARDAEPRKELVAEDEARMWVRDHGVAFYALLECVRLIHLQREVRDIKDGENCVDLEGVNGERIEGKRIDDIETDFWEGDCPALLSGAECATLRDAHRTRWVTFNLLLWKSRPDRCTWHEAPFYSWGSAEAHGRHVRDIALVERCLGMTFPEKAQVGLGTVKVVPWSKELDYALKKSDQEYVNLSRKWKAL
jgi:hypothetical protein